MFDSDSDDKIFEVKRYTEIDDGKTKFHHTCLEWKVTEHSFKTCKADERLESYKFRCSNARWLLFMYPNGQRTNCSVGRVEICLEKTHSFTYEHRVVAEITIACKNKYDNICEIKRIFVGNRSSCIFPSVVQRRHVIRKDLDYIQDGYFTLNCNLFVFKEETSYAPSISTASKLKEPVKKEVGTNTTSTEIKEVGTNTTSSEIKEVGTNTTSSEIKEVGTNTTSSDIKEVGTITTTSVSDLVLHDSPRTEELNDSIVLSNDFEALHDSRQLADVILKLGQHEFPAHKLVLRSRSKVFEAMFEHDMLENRQDTVDLIEMEATTVKDMLRYIYCGKVRHMSPEDALNLYVAADRYDLQPLALKCRKIMLSSLSLDNICDIAMVANLHNDQHLMSAVKSLLFENMKEVMKMDKWMTFCKENQSFSLQLIHSVILNN